jgi:hypothetical protein
VPALPIPPSAGPAAATPEASAAPAPRPRFGHLLEARLAPRSGPAPAASPPPLATALRSVEAAQARLEAVLAAARRGQAFSAGQLLALQADAHRLAQTLDVAGKLVEQGVQSVKQAIQAQA